MKKRSKDDRYHTFVFASLLDPFWVVSARVKVQERQMYRIENLEKNCFYIMPNFDPQRKCCKKNETSLSMCNVCTVHPCLCATYVQYIPVYVQRMYNEHPCLVSMCNVCTVNPCLYATYVQRTSLSMCNVCTTYIPVYMQRMYSTSLSMCNDVRSKNLLH